MTSAVADYIRAHKQAIILDWERAVTARITELVSLERGALIDHLPEVLDGLAAWIEGGSEQAEAAFVALADGHAVQRLGVGIELAVVSTEYAALRHVVLKHLLSVESSPDVREDLILFDEALDRAIHLATRRYIEHRDLVRDRFISILGHDLRNPLNAASMATTLLMRSGTLSPDERNRLQIIGRAHERMAAMVGDVLDFARGHFGGGIPVTPTIADLAEICRSVAEEVRNAHPERAIELRTHGDLRGSFDRERALQAIGNLLSNAIQHGEDPIVLTAGEVDDGHVVFTRISNGGRGISPERMPTLFEAFGCSGSETTGVGLGLYIVMQIARAHGGTCEVSSSAEETAFTIRWPRTPLRDVADRD
jgi:signal transduction histidine kinase